MSTSRFFHAVAGTISRQVTTSGLSFLSYMRSEPLSTVLLDQRPFGSTHRNLTI